MPERLRLLHSPSQHRWRTVLSTDVLLGIVLLSSLLLKLHNLDHQALTYWDEAFHALVARNLLHHPLKPTLVDRPYLPYDPQNWVNNHVWLHKPILPLWQIMLTYTVLGVNTFALRLPSALLSTGAVWLTYCIGRECFGARPGLIAATLQAFNPAIMLLVHGYLVSDHIDITLLWKAFTERHSHLWMLYAWAFGVLIPHILATTKTPSATLIGLPPFFLLLGVLISEAWQGKRWAWAMWISITVISLFSPGKIHPEEWFDFSYELSRSFSGPRRQALWIVVHVGGTFLLACILERAVWAKQRWRGVWPTSVAAVVRWSGIGCATVGMCMLGGQMLWSALEVTRLNTNEPTFSEIARFAQSQLPHNAVFLFEFQEGEQDVQGEHLLTMFRADRPCYRVQSTILQETACQVIQHGGIPYIVSKQDLSRPFFFLSKRDQRAIYAWEDSHASCTHR